MIRVFWTTVCCDANDPKSLSIAQDGSSVLDEGPIFQGLNLASGVREHGEAIAVIRLHGLIVYSSSIGVKLRN